jgi:phosphatidate cytidylyltransferase
MASSPDPQIAPAPARPAAAPARGAGDRSLPLRLASALVFVPILILLARAGEIAFWLFVALEVTLGLREFNRMMRAKGHKPYALVGWAAALGLLWLLYRPHTPNAAFLLTALLLLVLSLELRQPHESGRVENMAVTTFGVIYVGWLSGFMVQLRELPRVLGQPYEAGASYLLLAFFLTWSSDTGGYAVGRLYGRIRPWKQISPRKSLEGAMGSLLFALGAAAVARASFAPYLRWWDVVALGLLVGIFAQVGDLVESLLKRDTGLGESSGFIPGHGGILDRFDGLYFGAPATYYYLVLAVFGGG